MDTMAARATILADTIKIARRIVFKNGGTVLSAADRGSNDQYANNIVATLASSEDWLYYSQARGCAGRIASNIHYGLLPISTRICYSFANLGKVSFLHTWVSQC